MNDHLEKLLEKSKTLPEAPGVYLMKDDKERVIYVGKSVCLRDRVGSYFMKSTKLEERKQGLLEEVVDFEFIQTESEVEALLAENRLIKDIRPKYNVLLMDDKTYPYLMITTNEDFPGLYYTREPKSDGVKLYGPFTGGHALKEAVQYLQRAFKFRTCHLEILESDDKRRFFRPCLLYAINQCSGPCGDKISRKDYAQDIRRLIRYIEGDRGTVLKELEREMKKSAEALDFEEAGKLRDEIRALTSLSLRGEKGSEKFWQPEAFVSDPKEGVEKLREMLEMRDSPRIVEGFDIAHLQGGEMVGSGVCFIDGRPFKEGYRRFKIKHGEGNNDFLSLQEVVSRRYRAAGAGEEMFPDVILIDGGLGQLHAALEAFGAMDHRPGMVISLAKKEELVYVQGSEKPLKLPRNNAGLRLLQYVRDEAHRFAQSYHHLLRSKAQLEEEARQGRRPPGKRQKQ